MSESDKTFIGKLYRKYDEAPRLDGYTKVVVVRDENYSYAVGSELGRTITVTSPLVTPKTAPAIGQNVLSSIRGFQYRPYTAIGAILDPAAELGDGVTVNADYGGIYALELQYGGRVSASVSAPNDEEIDHEFPYVAKRDRKYIRQLASLSAELSIQSDRISATVSKTGGDASSFGWELLDKSWRIHSDGMDIFKAMKGGVEVYGKITATSGKIGGFDIMSDYLSTNNMTWGGTNSTGVYVGNKGIQLGKNLKMHPSGYFEAAEGKFSGTVTAGNIAYGGSDGYFDGSGISSGSIYNSRIADYTISSLKVNNGINTSLGYANFSDSVFNGYDTAHTVKTNNLLVSGTRYEKKTISFKDYYGNTRTFYVLAVAEE